MPDRSPARGRHVHVGDLHAASRLAVDAILALTRLVEHLHHDILQTRGLVGSSPPHRAVRGITGLVYQSIRGVTHLVGGTLDALLGQVSAMLPRGALDASAERNAVLAVLNGVLGDHLEATANPLATSMRLHLEGRPLPLDAGEIDVAIPHGHGRVLLLVHGLCMHAGQWRRGGHDHGTMLGANGDYITLTLNYNTGLHISTNGRLLAETLQAVVEAWPVPLTELVIVGHSAGGLVARSACHQAEARGATWRQRLTRMVFLGTPHHGAPLERGGHWIDAILDAGRYTSAFSRLGKLRSAGITDLRHGSLLDSDWDGADRFAHGHDTRAVVPLPAGVACYAIAASMSRTGRGVRGALLGDGLVPVASALGQHADPARCLPFDPGNTWIGHGLHHLDLLDDEDVRARLLEWLALPRPARRRRSRRATETPVCTGRPR